MRRFRLLGVMLVVACAMGVMAVSAFALPDISLTLGAAYPLHLNYLSNIANTTLDTAAGTELQGEGLHVLFLIGELTALGTFRAIF